MEIKDVAYSMFKYRGIGKGLFYFDPCSFSSVAQYCTFLAINICFDLKQRVGC